MIEQKNFNTTMLQTDLAKNRAIVYRILAGLYTKPVEIPDLGTLMCWCDMGLKSSESDFPEKLRGGLRDIAAWFAEQNYQPSAECLKEVNSEFVRLFRGLSRQQSPPPPYESVYVDEGHVYGPSTDQVTKKFNQYKLKVPGSEPPDHLPLELDFMRFLCEREVETLENNGSAKECIEEQYMFLDEHLMRWVPSLCENIRKYSQSRLYRGIADFTEAWINCDRDIVDDLREQAANTI